MVTMKILSFLLMLSLMLGACNAEATEGDVALEDAVTLEKINPEALKSIQSQIDKSIEVAQSFKVLSFDREFIHAKYKFSKEYVELTPLKNGWVVSTFKNAAGTSKTLSLAGIFNVLDGATLKINHLYLPKEMNDGEKVSYDISYEGGYRVQNQCTAIRTFHAPKNLSGPAVLFTCQGQAGSEGAFTQQSFEQVWLSNYGVMIDYDSTQAFTRTKPFYLKYHQAKVVW